MKEAKIFLALAAAIAVGCNSGNYEVEQPGINLDANGLEVQHGMIVLGEKMEDPYTVENMTKAFKSLYPNKSTANIQPTDLYVRFLPKTQDEYDLLEGLGAQMIDHPVDYKIVREGDYYHDAAIPENEFTWQYAVVGTEFQFPENITYELLDKCFITEHQFDSKAGGDIDWTAVERKAFEMTGNGGLLAQTTKAGGCPSGRITLLDDKYSPDPVGVKGIRVSCNVFVKFSHSYTDENGYYSLPRSFTLNPRYRLVFKNAKGFAQGFNLILVPASFSTLGTAGPEGVSAAIDKNSDRVLFSRCVVNNAAYDYFSMCGSGADEITSPPANLRIWNFFTMNASSAVMLQQGALIDNSILAEFFGEYLFLIKLFLPDVTIGLRDTEDYSDIYNLVVHELAHASHYMKAGKEYWNHYIEFILRSFVTSGFITYGVGTEEGHGYCEVGEMWAYYLQTRLYKDRYPAEGRSFGTDFWFHPQILMYMDERGLNKNKIFKVLTADVFDIETLQKKLLYYYPEMKTTINLAFERYQ